MPHNSKVWELAAAEGALVRGIDLAAVGNPRDGLQWANTDHQTLSTLCQSTRTIRRLGLLSHISGLQFLQLPQLHLLCTGI